MASFRDFLDTLMHDCNVYHQVLQWAYLGGHFVKTLKLSIKVNEHLLCARPCPYHAKTVQRKARKGSCI